MKELNFIAIFSTMERNVLLNQTAYSFMKIQLNVDMDNFVSEIIVCSSIKQMRRMWMTTKLRILKTLMKVNQTYFVNCEFLAQDELSLKVHYERIHSGYHDCALCAYRAENEESLNSHLFTCETFT